MGGIFSKRIEYVRETTYVCITQIGKEDDPVQDIDFWIHQSEGEAQKSSCWECFKQVHFLSIVKSKGTHSEEELNYAIEECLNKTNLSLGH